MLGYERIGQLVAVAAALPTTNNLSVLREEISIDFLGYVKSQVHLNISDDLFNRPFGEYMNALRFLEKGCKMYQQNAEKVLRYFYTDMANFLIRNPQNVKMNIQVGGWTGLPEVKCELSQVKAELVSMTTVGSAEELSRFNYAEILDSVKSRDDLLEKIDSYTVAAVLSKAAKQKELCKLVFESEVQ